MSDIVSGPPIAHEYAMLNAVSEACCICERSRDFGMRLTILSVGSAVHWLTFILPSPTLVEKAAMPAFLVEHDGTAELGHYMVTMDGLDDVWASHLGVLDHDAEG